MRRSKPVVVVTLCGALLLAAAAPAWAEGSSMDPFGKPMLAEIVLAWLLGDQGSIIDPNG